MSLSQEITEEYQRLAKLGEYSDSAATVLRLTGRVLELAQRLEALEEKLGPIVALFEKPVSAWEDDGKVAGLKLP